MKSCLASLEILDAHLVPSILSNPSNLHAQFLIDHWNNEINILRRCVFLIVDPAAFIDVSINFMILCLIDLIFDFTFFFVCV